MPRIPIDYSKTIIYKLVCNDLSITDCYVGHTTGFTKRKATHKSNCRNENSKEYNHKVYQFMRENGGWDNWNMVQIEEYNCNNKREAESRERYWYEELNGTLNSIYPARTKKEYIEDNKEKIKQQKKEYDEQNRETQKEYRKQYRDSEEYKEKIKQYREQNREKILKQMKQYYQAKKLNPPESL